MNHCSSRSHAIFRVNIKQLSSIEIQSELNRTQSYNINNFDLINNVTEKDELFNLEVRQTKESLLNFVDLAGSEKLTNLD